MEGTPLETFLVDLDETRGKLPCCQEISLIQRRVRKVIKAILLEVRRENPLFMTTLINSGSFYEGTKVGKPDEFDFFIQLDALSSPEDVSFEELPCSTVCVVPSKAACENVRLAFTDQEYGSHFFDFRDFEWKRTIKTPFYNIFNSKAKNFEAYGMKVVLPYENYVSKTPPALSKHGPAYTLLLEWNGGESDLYKGMKISVDLTLAVRINSKSTLRGLEFDSPSGRVLKSVLDSLPYFLAVGSYRDPLSEEHPDCFKKEKEQYPGLRPNNFVLRCSQSSFEQLLFAQEFGSDSGQSKCLRLLKVLRDTMFPDAEHRAERGKTDKIEDSKLAYWILTADGSSDNTGKLISSYVLKTLVLYEWQKNTNAELWTGSNLTQRLINILQDLVGRLKGKKLASFFYSDYNLFKKDSLDVDFSNAAAIIQILVDRLLSFKNLPVPEYKFEDCLVEIAQDLTIVCRKKKLITFLSCGLRHTFFGYDILQKVIEKSLINEGNGEIYESRESACRSRHPIEAAYRGIVEGKERTQFLDIYIQAFLDQIAPEETLALTNIKVEALESLSSAVKQFKDIARRRMAGHDDLPSYSLWSQEHWTIEQSFYKLTSDEPKKLLALLLKMFREDIKVLHDRLHGC